MVRVHSARSRREAEAFERALTGDAPPGDLEPLVRLAGRLPAPSAVPREAFVDDLRERLLAEAGRLERRPVPHRAETPHAGHDPVTVVLLRPRRLLGALVAAAVLAIAVVGGLSTRALPGDRLYPVRLGVGEARVRLAGDDTARGRALLAQVDQRLGDVDRLVADGDPTSAQVDVALTAATDDLVGAQRLLLRADGRLPDPDGLQALADTTRQAAGRLDALGPLPQGSQPALDRLRQALVDGQTALVRVVAGCGDACAAVTETLRRAAQTVGGGSPLVLALARAATGQQVQAGAGGRGGRRRRRPRDRRPGRRVDRRGRRRGRGVDLDATRCHRPGRAGTRERVDDVQPVGRRARAGSDRVGPGRRGRRPVGGREPARPDDDRGPGTGGHRAAGVGHARRRDDHRAERAPAAALDHQAPRRQAARRPAGASSASAASASADRPVLRPGSGKISTKNGSSPTNRTCRARLSTLALPATRTRGSARPPGGRPTPTAGRADAGSIPLRGTPDPACPLPEEILS
ncbi:hypothetical protein GCM10025868_30710 [Angustibacter aerolatus]|uniref:DUF5667 domain-containing protein n=1 Tax=Angustibacter aerolatus TaxID=1162965 RepID=A0ABQ6JHW0_9ACTN|nr:hypothetical protein [Angustibacter aerolatus]GMA87821.1 hypothetical protein GCM10025868_30710 [Angustibacter aerolatus]